jgi:hypothetical protein
MFGSPKRLARVLAATATALALSGCTTRTVRLGDLVATQTSLLTNNQLHATCTQYHPDGTPAVSVSLDDANQGDAAMAHELGQVALGLGAQIGKAAATGGAMAAAPGARAPAEEPPSPACLGEHFKDDKAKPAPYPPTPTPAQTVGPPIEAREP